MCAQKKQILNYETLSTRYVNDNSVDIVEGDIVVLSRFSNTRIYVKHPAVQAASLVFGVALDSAKPEQPIHLAQLGIAKVRVDNSNGNIVAGDKITTKGGNSGIGIKWNSSLPSSLVAFSLEDYSDSEPGLISCRILFNVSEAIIPSSVTGGGDITGLTFTVGKTHENSDTSKSYTIFFGDQMPGTDSYVRWDGNKQRFVFGGDVEFEGSSFMMFDEIIELNSDGVPSAEYGLLINRGPLLDKAKFIWNESTEQFEIGLEGNLSKVLTVDDLNSGGLPWTSAVEGDILVGASGGGALELYSASSGSTDDVLVNNGTKPVWGPFTSTTSPTLTIGKDNTDAKIYFLNSLSSLGISSLENNVIFSSQTGLGDLLRFKSVSGLESKILFTENNSNDYIANFIDVEVNTSSLITDVYGLKIDSSNDLGNLTNLYGIYVEEPIGATNNYSGFFEGHVHFDKTVYVDLNTSESYKIGEGSSNTVSMSFGDAGDFIIGYNSSTNTFGVLDSSDSLLRRFNSVGGFQSNVEFEITNTNTWNVAETIGNKFKVSVENTISTPPEYPNSEIYNIYLEPISLSTFDIKRAVNLFVGDVEGATTENYAALFDGRVLFQKRVDILGNNSNNGLFINNDFVLYNSSNNGYITTTSNNKNITMTPHGNGKIVLSKVASIASYTNASEPASGLPSDLWYNTTSKEFKTFDVDGTTKRVLAFVDSISGSNYVYTNTIQTITAQKSFVIPITSTVSNFTGTIFSTNINASVSVSNTIKSVEILRTNNSGNSGNNVGSFYSLFVGSPQSSAWGGRTSTTATGLFVEGPTIASSVSGNWAAQFTGRVNFNNIATINTSTESFNSFVFASTQAANITVGGITSATVRIAAPAIGGTANPLHTVTSLYLNAPLVTDAKNRSIYAEGAIESDNFIASLPSNTTNLASGHIRAGGTTIATINNNVHYHTIYANSYTNALVPDSGSVCISPYYNVGDSVTEALVNVRPFYGSGNNPNTGIRVWTVGSGVASIGLANPGSSSSNVNAFNSNNALIVSTNSSGGLFEVNGSTNKSLVFRNSDVSSTVNAAFEGGIVIGSEVAINERYLVLSSYSSNPPLSNNGALYYNSSTMTIKAQVSNGSSTVNKDLEFKLYWEKEQFEFYETGYGGSTAGKINIDAQTYVDLVYQPADAESVIFLIRHAGSQLKDIDYTVNVSGSNKRVNFNVSLIDEIKLATNITDTVTIQIVYVRRDLGN